MALQHISRSRWSAIGAAIAVSIGAGGVLTTSASIDSGERAVYVPIAPCRLIDTRPAPDTVGTRTSPLGPGEALPVAVRGTNGNCTIPADAVGVVMNVAVITPTADSFLTVFPSDVPRPLAANLNWLAGDPPLSNAVTADISADGRISFYNLAGTVHVAADVVGYYVDHTHDDRYYTETETDSRFADAQQSLVISGYALQPTGGSAVSAGTFCTTYSTVPGTGVITLALPLGTRITAVHGVMFDAAGANTYSLGLQRITARPPASIGQAQIGSAMSGGPQNGVVNQSILLEPAEVVDPGESFFVSVNLGPTAMTNGVCQLTVDFVSP